MDLDRVEQRIVNPALKPDDVAGDRSLSAVLGGDPQGGALSEGPDVPGGFTAIYSQSASTEPSRLSATASMHADSQRRDCSGTVRPKWLAAR
jgi:hypothetical protein